MSEQINAIPDSYFGLLSKFTVTREDAWRWTGIDPNGLLAWERKGVLITVAPGTYPAATSLAVFLSFAASQSQKNRVTSWVRHIVTEGRERDEWYVPDRNEQAILDAEARERNKTPLERLQDIQQLIAETQSSLDASERQINQARDQIVDGHQNV